MEAFITAERIANSISLDKSFSGHYILVEGKKDVKIYRRFILNDHAKIKSTFGKYQLREVYKLLSDREFQNKIGIRDADFLRINGNEKYDEKYSDHVFATDYHDSEVMIIESGSLNDYLTIISDEERVSKFENENKTTINRLIYNLAYNLGCLRFANKKFQLGLSFKPERPKGNKLKLSKFICEKKLIFLGNEKLINTVMEYSKNRNMEISNREVINTRLEEILKEDHSIFEIVNGHDMSEVLFMVSKNGLKSSNKLLQNADCVEDLLISSFGIKHFSKTTLLKNIRKWENNSKIQLFETA